MGPSSWNRGTYTLSLFFLTLDLVLNLFAVMLHLQADSALRYLNSFAPWFIVSNLVSSTALLFLIGYYLFKNLGATAVAALLFASVALIHAVVVYFMVTEQRLESYSTFVKAAVSMSLIAYGLSLISPPPKGKWLLLGGRLALGLGLALGIILLLKAKAVSFDSRSILAQAETALSMAASLLPLPFILNFRNELRALPRKRKNPFSPTLRAVILCTLAIALVPSIQLARDCASNKLGSKTPTESQKKLAAPFDARVFVDDHGRQLGYRLLPPENYDPEKSYPLAVCLHHGGGTGTENIIQIAASEFAQTLSEPGNRKKYPSFIFVPQCPPGSSFGGIPNYPKIDQLVVGAIAELEDEFNIDPSRRYVMGVSLGGFGAWHLIGSRPGMFAAAIPVCGGGNPDHAKDMARTPGFGPSTGKRTRTFRQDYRAIWYKV